ncbi:MAG TPA: alkaline phosphatase [Bacteroidales bacterium]|nr:alkaline phosphatase [Bacteroidales bacterium]
MAKLKLIALVIISSYAVISCAGYKNACSSQNNEKEIKNVILMIGDGMGLAHVYAAMTISPTPLNIERATVTGLQKNYSASDYITDSGASGTAMATGTKTRNRSIGVDPYGNKLKSILVISEDNGLATGLVSTSAITHATPASFVAHQTGRENYEGIALDFLKTDIDVMIGGGYKFFAKRKDNLNLIDSLKNKGYDVQTDLNGILKSNSTKLAGFTADDGNPYRLKGRRNMLPASTGKAIDILSKDKDGFFLMVEGSEIDWAAHDNHADTTIDEVFDFDQAIGVAMNFAERDGHTLVIVTCDHETGGVTITEGDRAKHTAKLEFSSEEHTAVMIPVYAFGPGAEKFTGIYDNTDIFRKIKAALGL